MVVSADIVKILNTKQHKGNFILVENVMEEFLKSSKFRTPDMFLNSLSFLFAVGLIEKNEYRIKLLTQAGEKKNKQMELF